MHNDIPFCLLKIKYIQIILVTPIRSSINNLKKSTQ